MARVASRDHVQSGINEVYFRSCEDMSPVVDASVDLAVASPPFTNHPDGETLDKIDYLDFLGRTFGECHAKIRPGGVLVTVNTDLRDHARYNRGDRRFEGCVWDKHSAIRRLCEDLGFTCIDTKIWAKTLSRDCFRYTFSYIQFFAKPGGPVPSVRANTVSSDFGADVWLLERGTKRERPGEKVFRDAIHPEIVERCVARFTKPGDLVLSPFTGSGTVPAVAHVMGRHWAAFEINPLLGSLISRSIYGPDRPRVYSALEAKYLAPAM